MREFWTVRRVAAALELPVPDDRPIAGISTDTRALRAGELFLALRGDRFDGHAYLRAAVERGAAAVVVDDGAPAAGLGVPVLIVDDTLRALGALAAHYRRAWARPLVAIGGSNGKTTTKDLVRAALGVTLDVHATEANLNNQVGVPLTLLGLHEGADVAVIEVGTNVPGEIEILRDIVRPDIAVITNVQEEHLEGFGDLAGVMAEELSLCDGVQLAIVPAGQPDVVAEARRRAHAVTTMGLEAGDVRASSWGTEPPSGGWIALGDVRVRVPVPGVHNLANAMTAVAVARAFGVPDADLARGIAGAQVAPMRSGVRAIGAALLLNDAYNANPGSMRAALAMLESMSGGRPQVAVLGTMRELGATSAALHDDVARAALAGSAALIGAIGDFAEAFARIAPRDERVVAAGSPAELWERIAGRVPRDAAILLKASRGVRLEQLVPAIEQWAGVASEANQPS